MRVLFVRPKSGFYVNQGSSPPLSSLALASFIQSKGHTVRVFDCQLERGLMKSVEEFAPDAVAVTLSSESVIPEALRVSRALKALGLPVFWGGHMASAIPEEIARSGYVDYVGISEGEYTLLELLEVTAGRRAPETVLGIAYVDENGLYHRTGDRPFADLADFPPLDYSLIPIKKYLNRFPFANRTFLMISSKGCIFRCTFCYNNEYHRCQRRVYPLEVLLQQIKTLAVDYGVNGVLFWDELFGVDKQELRAFCQGVKGLGLGLVWTAVTAVGILSREDIMMMHEAGCRMLCYGLESGSAEMRKKLHKYYDASKIDETVRNCRDAGILFMPNFMIGLPDETPEQLRETVRLYFRTHPDMITMSYYTPIPGSQLYRALEASGRMPPRKKTLEGIRLQTMEFQHLAQNFSDVPAKDLQVIMQFVYWQTVFGKKQKTPGFDWGSNLKMLIINLLHYLRCAGLRGLARGVWEAGKLFCNVAWYAHAYPSIRKKYDLYAKNFGRTDWDETGH